MYTKLMRRRLLPVVDTSPWSEPVFIAQYNTMVQSDGASAALLCQFVLEKVWSSP